MKVQKSFSLLSCPSTTSLAPLLSLSQSSAMCFLSLVVSLSMASGCGFTVWSLALLARQVRSRCVMAASTDSSQPCKTLNGLILLPTLPNNNTQQLTLAGSSQPCQTTTLNRLTLAGSSQPCQTTTLNGLTLAGSSQPRQTTILNGLILLPTLPNNSTQRVNTPPNPEKTTTLNGLTLAGSSQPRQNNSTQQVNTPPNPAKTTILNGLILLPTLPNNNTQWVNTSGVLPTPPKQQHSTG